MSNSSIPDLGLKDIRFLKAVRDISESPDEYPATDDGKAPATKTAIKKGASLSDEAVKYRFEKPADITTDGKHGLVEILSAKIKDNGGFGPKSARLTDKGAEVLETELENRELVASGVQSKGENISGGEVDTAIAKLEERIAAVEAKLDRVLEAIDEWESSSTGALDPDQTRALQAMTDAVPAHDRALKALGVEADEITDAEELDPDAVRQQVQATLLKAEGQPAGQRDQETAGDTSERKQDGGQVNLDSLQDDTE